ncbi:MAG: hypothetical protein ACRDGA_05750 [Bacteroidota bacterium]
MNRQDNMFMQAPRQKAALALFVSGKKCEALPAFPNRWYGFLLLITFLVFFNACEIYEATPYEDQIVLEAYLITGQRFDHLTLRRSVSLQELRAQERVQPSNPGDPDALSGATVALYDHQRAYPLIEDGTTRGKYKLRTQDSLTIGYSTTYHVRVDALGKEATAETTTPAEVKAALLEPTERIVYPDTPIKLKLLKPALASGFLIIAKGDLDQPPAPFFSGRSDIVTTDTVATLPWSMFWRFGKVRLYIYAIDKNYFDYLRTQKKGNPTQSLYQPASPVKGGLGIFASASIDSLDIFIESCSE